METYLEPQYPEHISGDREIQNENTRDNKDLPPVREVGHIHRLQGCLLPHSNTKPVQEVPGLSHSGSILPVQSTTIWSVHSSHGVNDGGEGDQTDCITKGYNGPPEPRRLVSKSQIPSNLTPA